MSDLPEARLYLVAPARMRAGPLVDLVPGLAEAGVDPIQLREKDLEAGALLRLAEPVAAACTEAGVTFLVNDRPDVALALGCGVHVGQDDIPVPIARRIVGPGMPLGLSTHAPHEIDAAIALGHTLDYFAVGPVYGTPTKPGRPAVGVELVRYTADRGPGVPWFAIGGIDTSTLGDVIAAGARRVVVVRAITEVSDPLAAARRLRTRLDEAPLD